jgi:hypothetical protein
MSDQIIVTGPSEIRAAVKYAAQYSESGKDAGRGICPLLCEELLLRLLNTGCGNIRVRARTFPLRYIEISAKGERLDLFKEDPDISYPVNYS